MFEDQLAHVPTDPPRRPETLPGLRPSAVVPRSALFLPLVFVALFAFFPLSILISAPTMRLALGVGKTSQGRVLSTSDASACRGSGGHRVIYAFSPEPSREFRGAATLCEGSLYYSVKAGDAVEVQFLPSDPAVNVLRDDSRSPTPPLVFFMLMPVFMLLMLSPMFVPQMREALRARRLFCRGRVVKATVVFAKKCMTASWPGWPGSSGSEVFVDFQTPSGERREAVAWCPNDWLLNQLAPGAKVHVAYTDGKRDRVALLEAFLR